MSADEFDDVETVLAPKVPRAAGGGATYSLTVIEGPGAGKSLVIAPGQPSRALVGQSPACALRLADRLVSRRHAAFELVGSRLRLTDLASTNGTFIHGLTLLDAYLTGGELVRLGETTIRVDLVGHGAAEQLTAATRF